MWSVGTVATKWVSKNIWNVATPEVSENLPQRGCACTEAENLSQWRKHKNVDETIWSASFLSAGLVEQLTSIPKSVVHCILTETFYKWKICTCFAPHILLDDEKDTRVPDCRNMQKSVRMYLEFTSSIVTGNETQSVAWKLPNAPKEKKEICRGVADSRQCFLFSLVQKRSLTKNSFQKVRQWMLSTIWKF